MLYINTVLKIAVKINALVPDVVHFSHRQTLKSAELKWYRINDAGQEEEYFNILLENVKVISVSPMMHDTRGCPGTGHLESVDLRYEKITWKYLDGNVQYTDAWNERTTA